MTTADCRSGQRIAFVEFYRISDAAEFMDHYYPSITFTLVKSGGPDSEPVSVGIDFSRSREDSARSDAGREDGSWKCLEVRTLLAYDLYKIH